MLSLKLNSLFSQVQDALSQRLISVAAKLHRQVMIRPLTRFVHDIFVDPQLPSIDGVKAKPNAFRAAPQAPKQHRAKNAGTFSPLAAKLGAHYALAARRQDGVFAEAREVEGMAYALDAQVDVYMPHNGTLKRQASFNTGGTGVRLAVVLEQQHYTPLLLAPNEDAFVYDAQALGHSDVPSDGNCFFHSIAFLTGGTARILRDLACDTAEARGIAYAA